nr:PREDICTED: replication protein A 70 kDa DNA-binding subunit B-like [Daucus carota subsp. sativus]
MSSKFASVASIQTGFHDANLKIKVRVTRLWRGTTKKGEEFTSFNILLLDCKNSAIHAFIPSACAYDLERKITLGTVNIISGFTVQAYKDTDGFRCVRAANQLIFSTDTKIQQVDDKGTKIANEFFDLYDHSEVKPFAAQTTYLIDIVGVITDHEIFINNITNRHGEAQEQAKFAITDGSSLWKVTFWDKFARLFVKAIWEKLETPVIIIIAGCRVQNFNSEVILTNVAGTKFYLNYEHHSVQQLRRMLKDPQFAKKVAANNISRKAELLTVEQIKALGEDFIQRYVLAHVNIMHVDETPGWFLCVCTSCNLQVEQKDDGLYFCEPCKRIVPYPEIKFRIVVLASDLTGTIQIILHDRQIRSLIGKRARQVIQEQGPAKHFPQCFKLLTPKPYTVKLEINETNITNKNSLYWATNICNGFKQEETEEKVQQTATTNDPEATSSSINVQGLSGLKCTSSEMTKD